MARTLFVLLLLCCAWIQPIHCECSADELRALKESIFESLIVIAKTILKFTNSSEAEQNQLQPILHELASRHKVEQSSESSEKPQGSPLEDLFRAVNESPDVIDMDTINVAPYVTSRDIYVTPQYDHVAQRDDVNIPETIPQTTIQTTLALKPIVSRETVDKRIEAECKQVGADCSPQNLMFCCEGLVCKRDQRLSPYGKCRF